MADKPTNRERLQEITAGIEQGIKELFESEKYMRYLSVMSKFHRYSVNNTMLIYMQRPDATLVAGFNKWKNQFERHVKKGEHGITIIAPTPYKKKIEEMKRDPDTHAPILDADGKAVMEEKEIEIPMFRPVKVFDVSQTDGKPCRSWPPACPVRCHTMRRSWRRCAAPPRSLSSLSRWPRTWTAIFPPNSSGSPSGKA